MPANSLYNELNALAETTDARPVPFAIYDSDNSASFESRSVIDKRYQFILLQMLQEYPLELSTMGQLNFKKTPYRTTLRVMIKDRYDTVDGFKLEFIQYYAESLNPSSRLTLPANSDTSWEVSMLKFLEYLYTENLLLPGILRDYLTQERPEVMESRVDGIHLHAYLAENTRLL